MIKYNFKALYKTLGPGILFASTAIGVSHLVQSTRAGASYGFALLWAILWANLFKYPFFEYASRYANVTGTSIIDGYKKMGNTMLWLYFLISLSSMFFVAAAVGAVTSGFFQNALQIDLPSHYTFIIPLALFSICLSILLMGKYQILDTLIKIIGFILLSSTIVAFVLCLVKGPAPRQATFTVPSILTKDTLFFLIALMGWMPTALDLSSWNSLWTLERIKQTGYKPTLKQTLTDFNFGYIITAVLALMFLTLGAFILYGTGKNMPNSKALFAAQVITLYTSNIGAWSYPIIALASFSIMFGTCIAVFDGYARAMARTSTLIFYSNKSSSSKEINRFSYTVWLVLTGIGGLFIILFFDKNLKQLVDMATTISFLVAPIIAIANFRLVSHPSFEASARPKPWLVWLSYLGIVFLLGFAALFLYIKIKYII